MLSPILFSTYIQYKEGTNAIASYLASTASKYGYSQDLIFAHKLETKQNKKPPKLKGRARKLARDSAKGSSSKSNLEPESNPEPETAVNESSATPKYLISCKDFTVLADFIASHENPAVKVPASFLTLVQRTVSLRRKHAKSLQYARLQDQSGLDSSHDYFSSVLQQVYDMLRVRAHPSLPGSDVNPHDVASNVRNIFDSLALEEPSEDFVNAPEKVTSAQDKSAQEPQAEFLVDNINDIEERYLAAHSAFHDINNIRSFLKKVWFMYRHGHFDLMNCAVVTNTAIDLVHRAQLKLEKLGQEFTYQRLAPLFFSVQCFHEGLNPAKRHQPGDPINFEAAQHADFSMMLTFSLLESFKSVCEKGSLPIAKPGAFGRYDPYSERDQKSAREKYYEDRIILLEALPDLCWLTRIGHILPAEDNVTRMASLLLKNGTVELWGIFAAQIFLDIHSAVRSNVGNAFIELQNHGTIIRNTLESNFKFHQNLVIENWPKPNDAVLRNFLTMLEEFVFHDPVQKVITHLRAEKQGPEAPPFRLMKQHPLYCGLLSFKLHLSMKQFGVDFANAWGSILYLSHLYNALEQEKLMQRIWPDMDLIIDYHKASRMFIGDRPKSLEEYPKRFALMTGVSVQHLASERRKNRSISKLTQSARGPRGLLNDTTPVSEIFKKPLDGESRDTNVLLLDNIKEILRIRPQRNNSVQRHWQKLQSLFAQDSILGTQFERDDKESVKRIAEKLTTRDSLSSDMISPAEEKNDRSTALDSIQLLESLFDALQSELGALKFDYFNMHRRCWLFLRILQNHLDADFTKFIGQGYLERENQLPFTAGYILQIGFESQKVANAIGQGDNFKSKIFLKAAGYLDEYLSTGIGSMEIIQILQNEARNLRYSEVDFLTTDEEFEAAKNDEVTFASGVEAMTAIRGTS